MRIHRLEKNLELGVTLKDRNQGKEIEIQAEEHQQKKDQIFEVTWNGQWSDDEEKMKNNVKIREVQINPNFYTII